MQFGSICGKLFMLIGRGVAGATHWVFKHANVDLEATYDQGFLSFSNCRSTKCSCTFAINNVKNIITL